MLPEEIDSTDVPALVSPSISHFFNIKLINHVEKYKINI